MATLRALVIGVGSIGERHVRCFKATGRAEPSVVEINDERRSDVAGRLGVSQAYRTLDDALRDPPDLAVVATPAPSHVGIATRLAASGVHVLIEKPLGVSKDGLEGLRAAVASNGVVAGVAYVYRSHPVVAAWREAVASGRFGRPLEIVAVSGQHFPTYRPAYRSIYYNDRAQGGGAIQDALTHLINACEWAVGPVTRLVADAERLALEGVTVEDTAHVLARHGRVMASYSLNQHQAPNEVSLTAVCERGTARAELHEGRWRWATDPGAPWRDEPHRPVDRDGPFVSQAHGFLDAVEGRAGFVCPLADGEQTLCVNLAALDSLATGAWATIGGSHE